MKGQHLRARHVRGAQRTADGRGHATAHRAGGHLLRQHDEREDHGHRRQRSSAQGGPRTRVSAIATSTWETSISTFGRCETQQVRQDRAVLQALEVRGGGRDCGPCGAGGTAMDADADGGVDGGVDEVTVIPRRVPLPRGPRARAPPT
jgi:hypothetical protein